MKKTISIVVSLIFLVGIGVWIYLLVFGKPTSVSDIFSDFGLWSSQTPFDSEPQMVVGSQYQGTAVSALRQITTRPVVGAVFTADAIRYMERGTGHIYDVALSDGQERLVSGTTIPRATWAIFSPIGGFVAANTESGAETIVGSIVKNLDGDPSFDGKTLPLGAREVEFAKTGDTLYYLLPNQSGSTAYEYNLVTGTSTQLFSLPLSDVRVLWGTPTYVYTTPTAKQRGVLYRVGTNRLEYVTPSAYALMGVRYGGGLVFSSKTDGVFESWTTTDGGERLLPISIVPEKCISDPKATSTLYCAAQFAGLSNDFPDIWYQGFISLNDSIFRVYPNQSTAEVLSDISLESGREIDVSRMGISDDGRYLYFINKNDDTLWMYDLTL